MTLAPALASERLRLRPLAPGDFPACAALMASDRAAGMGGAFGTRAARGISRQDAAGRARFGHGAPTVEAGHGGRGWATEAAQGREPGEPVFRHPRGRA